nr:6-phosphofructo-2-kinase/fructose-2,6-bisphosphatase isoform X2 [Ipomoea batatas]
MGTGSSKNLASISDGGENREDQGGSMMYVSLKIEDFKLKFKTDLIPHVFGSAPLAGSWDSSKALPMELESNSTWQLRFVVPPNHEILLSPGSGLCRSTLTCCLAGSGCRRSLARDCVQGDGEWLRRPSAGRSRRSGFSALCKTGCCGPWLVSTVEGRTRTAEAGGRQAVASALTSAQRRDRGGLATQWRRRTGEARCREENLKMLSR